MTFAEFRRQQADWYLQQFGLSPLQWGSPKAKIVIIGQAPSQKGQAASKPFWDETGEKMRRSWFRVTDKRPDLAIARKWLKQELSFLEPKLFLILGRMASEFFFPKESFESLISSDQILFGKKAFVLPHPSPLNIKWYQDHPDFLEKRLPIIRHSIHEVLP